jgi:hypothetical protein
MSSLATLTVQRLQLAPALFKHVGGIAEYAREPKPPVEKMPAVYVLPLTEKYGDNELINAVRQPGTEEIAIVLVVAVSPAMGAEVHDPFTIPRAALIGRLLGWQPDPNDGALLLSGCRLLAVEPTHLAYQYEFKRDHTERAG